MTAYQATTTDLASKRVVVMGLGSFGGGVGVAKFLNSRGADVLVTDLKPPEQLRDSLNQLNGLPIEYRLGAHNVSDFTTADLIVVNPAVDPRHNRFLRAADAANIPITTEIRLLIERLPNPHHTIAVTGTAGKSTVTAMIGHTLKAAMDPGTIHTGGNIGGSLLDRIDQITQDHWVVLELSSFMLDLLAPLSWSPHIAVITNLYPNHLDRHGSQAAYEKAKKRIYRHQSQGDLLILGPDLPAKIYDNAHAHVQKHLTQIIRIDGPPPQPWPLRIPGEHNQTNASLAAAVCNAVGVAPEPIRQALAKYQGLPHRLQLVCERNGVRYINDSKATTPQAAQRAIQSVADPTCKTPPRLHVILGGYDKHTDLAPLARFAAQHCHTIYTIGATGPAIAAAAETGPAQVIVCGTLDRAVTESITRAASGDTVALTPGCASWDQFQDYQQRGDAFAQAVLKHCPDPR